MSMKVIQCPTGSTQPLAFWLILLVMVRSLKLLFQIQIISIKSMSLQQRSKNSSPYKKSAQSILQSPAEAYLRQLYRSDNPSPVHRFSHIHDTQSVVQRLLKVKENHNFYKSSSLHFSNLYTKKGLLVETEERIFAEVLGLIDEIDRLKLSVIAEGEGIRQLQVERPDVEEQVNFHGYAERLTIKQCNELLAENDELSTRIDSLRAKEGVSLDQVLKIERQKYEELKAGLSKKTVQQAPRMSEQRIKELRQQIQSVEKERSTILLEAVPDFQRIRQMNEQLRLKTIQNLKDSGTSTDELIGLRDYLRREEQSRGQFMEELKRFKEEYRRMKGENEALRGRLSQRRNYETKENNMGSLNRGKMETRSLQKDSSLLKKERITQRFGEFQSIIREMQVLKR